MQESAQVKSSDCGNLVATAVDERKGEGEEGKEEREQEWGASSFIKMCLAWRQRRRRSVLRNPGAPPGCFILWSQELDRKSKS